jgi:hypothetical protein
MNHQTASQSLPDLVTDPAAPHRALRAHLRTCHACQRQLFLLQRVDGMLRPDLPSSDRPRRYRARRVGGVALAAALAVAAVFVLLPRTQTQAEAFTLRASDGLTVAQAQIRNQGSQQVVVLTPGAPMPATTRYVLWGSAQSHTTIRLGMLITTATGRCRARFVLPSQPAWKRLWMTPLSQPTTIVAHT